jgi:hypothetical protein
MRRDANAEAVVVPSYYKGLKFEIPTKALLVSGANRSDSNVSN